jgi:hypothetical protein
MLRGNSIIRKFHYASLIKERSVDGHLHFMVLFFHIVMVFTIPKHMIYLSKYSTTESHADNASLFICREPIMPGGELWIGIAKMIERLSQKND